MNDSLLQRLAVCSWSLQPAGPDELLGRIQEIGIPRIQLALDPLRDNPALWSALPRRCADLGIAIVSGMFGCVGEDYTTMESIRRTGGIVPDATWDQNRRNIEATAQLAAELGLKLVTFHAGFLPHDERDPGFEKLLTRLREVAELFARHHIDLGLETGQESAETLREFLVKLNCANVGVNFDPANMLLYDKGDPIAAVRALGPWLKQCHLKDARKTKVPGSWGEEVAVGTGEVDWPAFFRALDDLNFTGIAAFEREAGESRVADIQSGRRFVENLFAGK